jgi:hypothetical protein
MTRIHLSTVVVAGSFLLVSSGASAAPPGSGRPAGAVIAAERPTPPPSSSTDELSPNSVYAEGLGAGLAYSINYERIVVRDLGVRAGFGYWGVGASATVNGQTTGASASFLTVPVTASYLGVRSGKHALELGGGATLINTSGSGSGFGMSASGSAMSALGTAMVGYRLHPVDHAGFQFRVGAMAVIGKGLGLSATDPDKIGVLPWLYLSLGASF